MDLPVLAEREHLVRRYALLLNRFGAEMGSRPLVRQNGTFFPDRFERDEASVVRLVRRMAEHAGLQDIPIDVRLDGGIGPAASGGCSSGGCAPAVSNPEQAGPRIVETARGWQLNVHTQELAHPAALACLLATSLGHIFLAETTTEQAVPQAPLEVSAELASVGLGLGLLLLEGSYVYSKSCGGPSVAQLTSLSVGQLAIACALFMVSNEHSLRPARASLSTTQQAALAEAFAWADSNRRVLSQLRNNPKILSEAPLNLTEKRSWLDRWTERRGHKSTALSPNEPLPPGLSAGDLQSLTQLAQTQTRRKPDAKRDELAALVEETLRSS